MKLDRVTITGADDGTDPKDLIALSAEFPWVEWGILASKSHEGAPRYPTRRWVERLVAAAPGPLLNSEPRGIKLSAHVCGRWVRDLLAGDAAVGREWHALDAFQRLQLNFHGEPHQTSDLKALLHWSACARQVIVQMDGNERLLGWLRDGGVTAVPLFDASGGAGLVPDAWPRPIAGIDYHGYAGGLGPATLARELPRIAEAATLAPGMMAGPSARIWIDMETRVRSDNDRHFDLDKVRRCLEITRPMITAA